MSRAWAIVLEQHQVRVFAAGNTTPLAELPWHSEAASTVINALAALPSQPSRVVLIVGLAWLEAAPLTLPPVAVSLQRRMVQLDADRWFPIVSEQPSGAHTVAVAIAARIALATSSARLAVWVRDFGAIAPVDGVVTLPQASAMAGLTGTFATTADDGETGVVELGTDGVRSVRRMRATPAGQLTPLNVAACAHAVLRGDTVPLDVQLLDTTLERQFRNRRRVVWWRAGAVCAAALGFCLWGVDQWRERTLVRAQQERSARETSARPALDAEARRQQALAERQLVSADTGVRTSDVLAALGDRLPADVFVQRAEWDGTEWRIDGSARNAATLVPLLSSIAGISNVRALAPSTRFLDGGQQRSSFSIGFRLASSSPMAP
ncbi:MAG: PilN domain-containing protein [Gemmatimonas sp.]|uniref:PilN domain-containing protein n=1 Tax=Gemmatimonas sp. TaxID=1962908 RepID=UPI0031BD70AD|nr:PilN domain-containing protein [Gemmatimonas sp.]